MKITQIVNHNSQIEGFNHKIKMKEIFFSLGKSVFANSYF